MIFFLSISPYIHLQIRREECSVFYSMVAFVLVPGLVGLLRTHAQHMLSSILLSFPLLSPLSLILQLQVHSHFPSSCVSVFIPRTYTILPVTRAPQPFASHWLLSWEQPSLPCHVGCMYLPNCKSTAPQSFAP